MKIVHLTATHLNGTGGIPTVLKNLVEEQNKIETVEAKVVSLNADVSHMQSEHFVQININELEKYFKDYKPDIVIIHSFYHVEYAKVAKILKRHHIRYYIEPHGSFMKEGMKKSRIKKQIANSTLFRILIHSAFGYIYLNEGERQRSIYHTKNDVIIPNGIDLFNKTISKSDSVKLYYIGRYDIHEKGIDLLLEALSLLDMQGCSFVFDFFGDGNQESRNYISDKISEFRNITCNIHDPIFGDEKDTVLSKYNISVLLSRHEGLPMTILESWNYGNPCIVTPETNMAEECVTEGIGWSVDNDVEKIAKLIKKVVEEYSNDNEGFIKRCRVHIEKQYSWEKIANQSCRVLRLLEDNDE